jgi:hypothetical protein
VNRVARTSSQMCCFHSGLRRSSRLPPRRAHSFGQNTRSCPRSYRTGDSKPLRRVFLEMILAGKNFCALSRTNKGCSRSTKTFACRTIQIARNARFRSRWRSGHESDRGADAPSRAGFGASPKHASRKKFAIAGRDRQHARRVRSPEFATARENTRVYRCNEMIVQTHLSSILSA